MDDRLYTKRYQCPVCQKPIATLRPKQRACIPLGRDTDFCVTYKDISPLLYEVVVCPQCGYAFNDNMPAPSLAAQKLHLTEITPRWQGTDFGGIRCPEEALAAFKLAILGAEKRIEKSSVLAGLCIRVAWLYRGLGETEQEQRFLSMALKDYQSAFNEEDLGEDAREITFAYLIGELNRRLDNPEAALRWFNLAISHPDAGRAPQIVKMAREQWRLTREQPQPLD